MSKDSAAVKLGRKGGKSTSPAKQAAVRANVAKARAKRAERCDECNAQIGLGSRHDLFCSKYETPEARKAKQEKNNDTQRSNSQSI